MADEPQASGLPEPESPAASSHSASIASNDISDVLASAKADLAAYYAGNLNPDASTDDASSETPPVASDPIAATEPVTSDDSDDDSDDLTPDVEAVANAAEGSEEPKLSRRQRAEKRVADEKAAILADVERLMGERDEANRRAAEFAQAEEQRKTAAAAALGSDEEFTRLTRIVQMGGVLEEEDQQKLATWASHREFQDIFRNEAANQVLQAVSAEMGAVANMPGVDANILRTKPFGEIFRHLHAVGAESVRSEATARVAEADAKTTTANERISQLEAQIKALQARVAGTAAAPEVGGQSVPSAREPALADVRNMSAADYLKNRDALLQQLRGRAS